MSRAPKRDRGVVLTQQGVARLEKAITSAQEQEKFGKRFTQAELSERANLSIKTIKKIREHGEATDEGSIHLLFSAFGLKLLASDYGIPERSKAKASNPIPSNIAGSFSSRERLSLIRLLNALPHAQFDEIVFALEIPRGVIPHSAGPQGNRAKELLDWAEGPTGCGISEITDLLTNYVSLDDFSIPQVGEPVLLSHPTTLQRSSALPQIPKTAEPKEEVSQDLGQSESELSLDWLEAPDVSIFYGRKSDLDSLKQWVTKDKCRLVFLLGMGGIGKTSLAAKLRERIQEDFTCIAWKSLKDTPPLSDVLENLIRFISKQKATEGSFETTNTLINKLLDHLKRKRCLIILDNLESILEEEKSGIYRQGYEGYGELFKRLGETVHQSCLILTSREKPREISVLEGPGLPVRCWQMQGVEEASGTEILKAKGLTILGQERFSFELIHRCGGNPLALKLVTTTIQELFDGDIQSFLKEETIALDGVRYLLDEHFNRLSDIEETVMYWLAINREPTSIEELSEDINPSVARGDLLEALKTLVERSLIEKINKRYTQQPVVMEYCTGILVNQAAKEIENKSLVQLNKYAFVKSTSKDYVRHSQYRLFANNIVKMLSGTWMENHKNIEAYLTALSRDMRESMLLNPGYAVGNILNLLRHLNHDFQNNDLSKLFIIQSDFRGVNLSSTSFVESHIEKTTFSDTFGYVLSADFCSSKDLLATRAISFSRKAEDARVSG